MDCDSFDDSWDPMKEHYWSEFKRISHSTDSSDDAPFLYVKDIPMELRQESLEDIFNQYGHVTNIKLTPSLNGKPTCLGFIFYGSVEEAREVFSRIPKNMWGMHVSLGKSKRDSRHAFEECTNHFRPHDMHARNVPPEANCCQSSVSFNSGRRSFEKEQSNCHSLDCQGHLLNRRSMPGPCINHKINDRQPIERRPNCCEKYAASATLERGPHPSVPHAPHQCCEVNGNPTLPIFSAPNLSELSRSVISHPAVEQLLHPPCVQYSYSKDSSQQPHYHPQHAELPNHEQTSCSLRCNHTAQESFPSACTEVHHCSLTHSNTPPLVNHGVCTYCKLEGKFSCGNCNVRYCSRTCQRQDWPNHKLECNKNASISSVPTNNSVNTTPPNIGTNALEVQRNNLKLKKTVNDTKPMNSDFQESGQRNHAGDWSMDSDLQGSGQRNHAGDRSMGRGRERFDSRNRNDMGNEAISSCDRRGGPNRSLAPPPHESSPEKSADRDQKSFEKSGFNQNARTCQGSGQRPRKSDNFKKVPSVSPRGQKSPVQNPNKGNNRNPEMDSRKPMEPVHQKPHMRRKINFNNPRQSEASNRKAENVNGTAERGNFVGNSARSKPREFFLPKHEQGSVNILVPAKIKASSLKFVSVDVGSDIGKVSVCYVINPCKFYVQREHDNEILVKIGREMADLSQSKTALLSPTIDDVCGALYSDDIYYRARITKILPDNSCLVYFLDYGNECVVKNSNLCFLTSNLGNYPALALKFGLVDVKPDNDKDWTRVAIDFFSHQVEYKSMKANIVRKDGSLYVVDLITEEGLHISKLLADHIYPSAMKSKISTVKEAPEESLPCNVPTMLSCLKVSAVYSIAPVYASRDTVWGFVDDPKVLEAFAQLEVALQDSNTPDLTMTIKEGDLASAFSSQNQHWYRAVVLKKNGDSYNVRYIDYGNEEEVSKLRRLTPEQRRVCSPLLGFHIISKGHQGKIQELSENNFDITVEILRELNFRAKTVHLEETIKFLGFDWSRSRAAAHSPLPEEDTHQAVPLKSINHKEVQPSPTHRPTTKAEKINTAKKILVEREIPANDKTEIMVTWVKSPCEIYVQMTSYEAEYAQLALNINASCNREENVYEPIEGEIVCARSVVYGQWYRSLVLKRVPGHKVRVRFIDYGNEEDIPLQDIRQLDQNFSQLRYSILVSLCGMPPAIVCDDLSAKLLEKRLELQVVNSEVTPKQVILYENGKQIFVNDDDEPTERAALCSDLLPSKSTETQCFPTKKKCDLEANLSDFDGGMVRIEHIDALKVFYVHLISQDELFTSMHRELSKRCELKMPKIPYIPDIDDVVCFRSEGAWKRGCITILKGNTCMVQLVDYGPTLEILVADILPLPPQCCQRFFVLSVCLESVPKSKLTDKVCENMKGCTYTLKVSEKSKPPVKCKMYLQHICVNDGLAEEQIPENPDSPPPLRPLKPKNLQFKALKMQKLPLNKPLDVVFYFKENDKYYLQKVSDYEEARQMALMIKLHCEASDPLTQLPQAGDLICAKASDEQWYRACVGKVCSPENKCQVYYVDYGNTEDVTLGDMRSFPPSLDSIPVFCICVKVVNAASHPIEMEQIVTIKPHEIETDPQVVNVYIPEENGCSSTSSTLEVSQHVHDTELTVSNAFAITNLPAIDLPKGNQAIVIYSIFGDTVFAAPFNNDNVSANVRLSQKITEQCNTIFNDSYKPALQEVVLAKFSDGMWYRAVVQDIKEGSYELLFIDYGGIEDKTPEDIRKMTEEFFQLPVQAKICTLGGFQVEESNKTKVQALVKAELETFTEIEAVVSAGDFPVVMFPSLTKKLQDMGLVKA